MLDEFTWLYYFSAPLIIVLLLRFGALTGFRSVSFKNICQSTFKAFAAAGLASSAILYLSKAGEFSRLFFGLYFLTASCLVLLEKSVVKKMYDRYLASGRMNTRIAMVGFGGKFAAIASELDAKPQWGIKPVIMCDPREASMPAIAKQVWSAIVDEVYVIYPRDSACDNQMDELLVRLERYGLPVKVALNFDELQSYYGQHPTLLAHVPGIFLTPHNLNPDQHIIKRLLDILGATAGLLLLLVISAPLGILIKLDSPGPIFFSQIRAGKGGRNFKIYKFRSMYCDAEILKHKLTKFNKHAGPLFKMDNDPRITRVGRFIRKYSMDELPQFINVLKGDMSLVGTRPPTLDEVREYEEHHHRRISLRPGLTGLWQISGRNEIRDFERVVELDNHYIKSWSIMGDIKIILMTLRVVMFPSRRTRGL